VPLARHRLLGGAVLAAAGIVLSLLYTGSALSTTSIGMLIPMLSDIGDLRTRFGTQLLAAGAVGEFGPILLITLILSAQSTAHNAAILLAFIGLAVAIALIAVRSAGRTLPVFERTIESQLPARGPLDPRAGVARSRCSPPNSGWTCCSAASPPE